MRSDGKYGSKILLEVIVVFFLMITQGCTYPEVYWFKLIIKAG